MSTLEWQTNFAIIVGKIKCYTPTPCKGIKVGNGTVYKRGIAATQMYTVATSIGNLRIAYENLSMAHFESMTCHIVQNGIFHKQTLVTDVCRINLDTPHTAMYITIVEHIALTLVGNHNALPLRRNTVVGLVREHITQTVAFHHNWALQSTLGNQRAINTQTCIGMEVKACTWCKTQCSSFCNDKTVHDLIRTLGI